MKATVIETDEKVNVELTKRDWRNPANDIFTESCADLFNERQWWRYELDINE